MTARAAIARVDQHAIRPPSRGRFAVLDGLRGICAIAVVIYHTSFLRGVAPDIMVSGYLAVDCFFMMSGFVLCHAYGRLLDQGRITAFMRKRWIRLAPIWWIGLVVCAVDLVILRANGRLPNAVGEAMINLTMLPSPWNGTNQLFSLNTPGWSLFYELVINLIYAAALHRMGQRALALTLVVSGFSLAVLSWSSLSTDGGNIWADSPIALARVTYSFVAGSLLCRARLSRRGNNSTVALGLCSAVVAILLVDVRGVERWTFDLTATLLILPAIVIAATIINVPPRLASIFERLGMLSYPLYVLHWPIFILAKQIFGRFAGWGVEVSTVFIVAVVSALIPIAYLIGIIFDPIAARLSASLERRLSRRSIARA